MKWEHELISKKYVLAGQFTSWWINIFVSTSSTQLATFRDKYSTGNFDVFYPLLLKWADEYISSKCGDDPRTYFELKVARLLQKMWPPEKQLEAEMARTTAKTNNY